MNILKLFQFAYIFFAILFFYDGVTKISEDLTRALISFFFSALAIFMYFFRKRFSKKFKN